MFAKAAKALGLSDFELSQFRHYADALRHGAFEVGAPTDHVELVTGHKPESFESIARRYTADPSLIAPRLVNCGKLQTISFMMRMLLARVPDFDQWERDSGHPMLNAPVRAPDNEEWLASAEKQQLNLLPTST